MQVQISYSHSTIMRCRCKYCGSAPSSVYFNPSKLSLKDPTLIMLLKSFIWKIQGVRSDFYLIEDPKAFTTINYFSSKINYNKTGIKYRQYYKVSDKLEMNNILFLCDCFKTTWTMPINDRDHIKNRKSQKIYPSKLKLY